MPPLAADDDFRPCRDDKCPIERVHREHPMPPDNRKKVITTCPDCDAALIALRGKRGICSRCSWRGSIILERDELEDAILVPPKKKPRRPRNA